MFKIYDLNFREVSMPLNFLKHGMHTLDLFITSIDKRVTSDEVIGVSGTQRSHVNDGSRQANITLFINSANRHDYKLKRSRVFSFFRQLGNFYVAEEEEPNKLLKVAVDESYNPQWLDGVAHAGQIDITLSIIGKPYRISRFTTLDIHNGLIRDGKWARGMHLNRSPQYQNYVFENQTNIEVYNPSDIDLYIKQHLDFKIKIECLQNMSRISLIDGLSKEFVFTDSLVTGDVVEIEGHRIRKNGRLSAEKFNDVYPTLLSGYSEVYQESSFNTIRVNTGLKVTFDFRPKYD